MTSAVIGATSSPPTARRRGSAAATLRVRLLPVGAVAPELPLREQRVRGVTGRPLRPHVSRISRRLPHSPVSYSFTAVELARLQAALAALLNPVTGGDGADWPAAATDAVRRAVGVDDRRGT